MLDAKLIREQPDKVKNGIATKGFDPSLVDQFLAVEEQRRVRQTEVESLRAEQKKVSGVDLSQREAAKAIKAQLEGKEKELAELEKQTTDFLLTFPNLPSDDTPLGKDDSENQVIRQHGTPPNFDFPAKEHWELGETLGLIDTERAAKVSGSRFAYLKGQLALLEFALIQHAMKVVTDQTLLEQIIQANSLKVSAAPFVPVVPPVFIKPDVYQKMARLEPKEERYYIPSDDIYLIGSAEHTLGSMHLDETFSEAQLPIRYVGFSTAFRREAGSYGKDMKGILRLHQFDKVELESFTLPEQGIEEQNFFVAIQEYLMQSLGLAYQVVICCTGDQGDPDARHLDIETWMPGQNKYRETHSADYMADYQARRLKARVKRENGTEYVHMNDATAFAVGRTLIAIMENGQQADGSIRIPDVLVPYCGFTEIKA